MNHLLRASIGDILPTITLLVSKMPAKVFFHYILKYINEPLDMKRAFHRKLNTITHAFFNVQSPILMSQCFIEML